MAAMRANDLHCGRGSSPLRTKFKSSPKSKSKSPSRSPSKGKQNVFYQIDNGIVNITTPVKSGTKFGVFETIASQRSETLNSFKQTTSPKKFQRRCKVSKPNSGEKLNKEFIIHQERKRMLTQGNNSRDNSRNDDLRESNTSR